MKIFTRAATVCFAVLACLLVAWVGSGVAQASPLLAPPPSSKIFSEAPTPDGAIHGVPEVKPKGQITNALMREEVKYGTGVTRGGVPETGTMNVFSPSVSNGGVVTYIPPTDSLYSGDAPSRQIDSEKLSDSDVARINAMIAQGYTVIVPDAYGDHNPQYAGKMNAIRIANAVLAYRQLPGRVVTSVACYGFSGGGIDCARVAQYRWSNGLFDQVIVDSGPTDLGGFLANPGIQNGLGWDAGGGNITSASEAQWKVLQDNLRPSTIVGYKLLRTASDIIPIPKLVVGVMTASGLVLPLPLKVAFKPGALEKPEVQALLRDISPGVPDAPFGGTMVFRCNQSDAFVPSEVHCLPAAEQYRLMGTNTTVITNHGQVAPGHAMMPTAQLLALLAGDVPSGDVDTYSAEMSVTDKVLDTVLTSAMWGISVYGAWLTEQAPAVLDELDRVVVDADKALDQVIAAPADAAEVVTTAAGQGQQLLEQIATPQSVAPTVNSETAIQAADEWLVPHDAQAVEDFVSSAPAKEVIDSAPVTLPPLPAPGDKVDIGGLKFTVPPLPALG